jgi:hypothetical protein
VWKVMCNPNHTVFSNPPLKFGNEW